MDGIAVGQDYRPLDAVLELAHVAGPRIGAHLVFRGRRQDQRLPVQIAAVFVDEVAGERGDVVRPLPERRDGDGEYRQTEVQVLAVLSGRNGGFQIAIGGCDNAHVHLQRRGAAHALEALLLERAQNLRLQRQRQIADFIEKQRAAVGELELPRLAVGGAGERPLLVAEQLGLEQRLRDGRTIDRHERAVGAGTQRVQRSGEQLLAGAALAFDQDGRVGRRRAMQRERHRLQLRVVADNLRRAAALRQLLFQQDVFRAQPPLCQRPLDHQQQDVGIDRLGKKIERSLLHRRHRVVNAAERGHDNDRQLGLDILGRAQDADPVAFGQTEIGQHNGRTGGLEGGFGLALIACLDNGVPLRLERVAQHGSERVFVFDEQDRRVDPRADPGAHRTQPGGTPARRASSSKPARPFLSSSICFFSVVSSASAFWRSRSMTARCAGSARLTKSVVNALMRDCSASATV